jgi:hypothetical protein
MLNPQLTDKTPKAVSAGHGLFVTPQAFVRIMAKLLHLHPYNTLLYITEK